MLDHDRQRELAEVYALLGNALLIVPSDPELPYFSVAFWAEFPDALSNEKISKGLGKIAGYLAVQVACSEGGCERVALEFTHLFIGPPEPAAAPWESLNRGGEGAVGYGKPALAMARLLADKGLEVSNKNNQYPDHLGIELLFLAFLCEQYETDASKADDAEVRAFIEDYPLGWVATLREKVEAAYPDGFYAGLLLLVEGTLRWHQDALDAKSAT